MKRVKALKVKAASGIDDIQGLEDLVDDMMTDFTNEIKEVIRLAQQGEFLTAQFKAKGLAQFMGDGMTDIVAFLYENS